MASVTFINIEKSFARSSRAAQQKLSAYEFISANSEPLRFLFCSSVDAIRPESELRERLGKTMKRPNFITAK